MKCRTLVSLLSLASWALAHPECQENSWASLDSAHVCGTFARKADRDSFIDDLLSQLTVTELAHQLHLTFADNIIGPNSTNELYDAYLGPSGIGLIHDWYPTNQSQYNDLQKLHLSKARVPIPLLQTAECLHGVGSFRQSLFPSPIGLAASFDPELMYRVGRAIGAEASSIGVRACFSPVLDLGKDPRWGRVQEDLGEDFVLTTHMGVAYARGLSKNGTWSAHDAVIPVMKHFAGHGSPSGGVNAGPFTGFGIRQIMSEMLVPFKAVVELGGARGVMMAYHDIDGVPCVVDPDLYKALASWNFDGFVLGDDVSIRNLQYLHRVADSPASAISQWINAGGAVQYYDYSLDVWRDSILGLVDNGTVSEATLRQRARGVLNAKWDLGLFDDPYIPGNVSVEGLVEAHDGLTLEAAEHSIVLLENRRDTLPLRPSEQGIQKIALVGPMADTFNFGDYSGPWGSGPIDRATTIRDGISEYLKANASSVNLVTSWGANTWLYNGQYPIPRSLLSSPNGTRGGLLATYYSDTHFSQAAFQTIQVPNMQWGLYPPNGLPSNNFSAVWEGHFTVPSDADGWLGLAIGPNSTASLEVDGSPVVEVPYSSQGTFIGNIEPRSFTRVNSTLGPPGCAPFAFRAGATHSVRVRFQVWNNAQKVENVNSLNAQIQLVWNLVDRRDPIGLAARAAEDADVIVFAGGGAWNSDGENGDRATLSLSANQTRLLDRIFQLGKPVVMVLEGGRPFAIPDYYARAAAVLYAYFPGQQGGRAIANVLFGLFNPGGRLPLSIPSSVGSLPAIYNYKQSAHIVDYVDIDSYSAYSFGYGLSYSTFIHSGFSASSSRADLATAFTANDTITFRLTVQNAGPLPGSDVPQVYLLSRVSSVVQPLRQLVAFKRVYLDGGEEREVEMTLDPSQLLLTYTRSKAWEVERGEYTFALTTSDRGGDVGVNATLTAL